MGLVNDTNWSLTSKSPIQLTITYGSGDEDNKKERWIKNIIIIMISIIIQNNPKYISQFLCTMFKINSSSCTNQITPVFTAEQYLFDCSLFPDQRI